MHNNSTILWFCGYLHWLIIALAYVYDLNGKVHVHQQWSNTKYGTTVKPKSDILLDEHNDPIAFGDDAIRTFRHHSIYTIQINSDWIFLCNYK